MGTRQFLPLAALAAISAAGCGGTALPRPGEASGAPEQLRQPASTATHYLYASSNASGVPGYQLPLTDSSAPIGQIVVSGSSADASANGKYIFVDVYGSYGGSDIDVYSEPLMSGNTGTEVCNFTNYGQYPAINSNQSAPFGKYLYVVDYVNNTLAQYAGVTGANPCPSSPVATTSTGNSPEGIAVNKQYIYVANFVDNTIAEYAQGSPFTSGEAALLTISDVAKHNGPQWLALSSTDLFVSNPYDQSISVYKLPLSSTSRPRKLTPANTCNRTGGNAPSGIAVDTGDTPKMLYVATDCGLFGYTIPLKRNESPSTVTPSEGYGGMGIH